MSVQGFIPSITAPVAGQSASGAKPLATTGGTGTNGTSTGNGTSATSLQATFLNLLATELQNQDPTQPVDPTEMVGQLVSLNQLDQLISINSTLTNLTGGSSTTGTGTGTGSGTGDNPDVAGSTQSNAHAALQGKSATASQAKGSIASPPGFVSGASELPAGAPANVSGNQGLMNLYGNFSAQKSSTNSTYTGAR